MSPEGQGRRRLFDPSSPIFALQWSLIAVVVTVQGDPRRAAFGAGVALLGLIWRRLTVSPLFWSMAAGILIVWSFLELPLLDNTAALLMFWTAAVAVSLFTEDWVETLAENARWVMAGVFGLAVFWKVVSPDYLSGAFFEWTLLVDPRFEPLTRLFGADPSGLAANREMVAAGVSGALHSGGLVPLAAGAFTWGTLAIEGAVAALWALGERAGIWRHVALVVFATATYIIIPVAGFAVTLIAMAMASVRTPRARIAYAAGAIAVFVYSVVFTRLVLG